MAQIYAALKMEMGSWLYYSVKMKMSEVASEIKFAYEVNDDKTLDTAIQREIGTSRAGTQIVNYLVQNEHRFFNSLLLLPLTATQVFRLFLSRMIQNSNSSVINSKIHLEYYHSMTP